MEGFEASKFNTEKYGHGWLNFYNSILARPDVGGSILEIGIASGASLRHWKSSGKFHTVVGIDLELPDPIDGVAMYVMNQSDNIGLEKLANQYNGFDVIIDDGCHIPWQMQTSFSTLWKHTRKLYIIEDWDIYVSKDGAPWAEWIKDMFNNKLYGVSRLEFMTYGPPTKGIDYILLEKDPLIAHELLSPPVSVPSMRPANMDISDFVNFLKGALPDNSTMVEIGSYQGESTESFAQSGKFSIINAVDPWMDNYDPADPSSQADMASVEKAFDIRTGRYPQIKKLKLTSEQAAERFPNRSLNMVYIDGIHQKPNVIQDINLWLPKIKPGGFITGHDYWEAWLSVKEAVNETLGKPDEVFFDSSWVVQVIE